MINPIRESLLIETSSGERLFNLLNEISLLFVGAFFILALVIEFLGEMNFLEVVKRLFIVVLFLASFYKIHNGSVSISMDTAYKTLKKVSPRNFFVKKWYRAKFKTKVKSKSWIDRNFVPNLNDLIATGLFIVSKLFLTLAQFIYSVVYHFTYIYSGYTALLYFFKMTQGSLRGTIISSIWCNMVPFVLIGIFIVVGGEFDDAALTGNLAVSDIETLIWLFCSTLMILLVAPISYMIISGSGVAAVSPRFTTLSMSMATNAILMTSMIKDFGMKTKGKLGGVYKKLFGNKSYRPDYRQNFKGVKQGSSQKNNIIKSLEDNSKNQSSSIQGEKKQYGKPLEQRCFPKNYRNYTDPKATNNSIKEKNKLLRERLGTNKDVKTNNTSFKQNSKQLASKEKSITNSRVQVNKSEKLKPVTSKKKESNRDRGGRHGLR